MQTLSYRGREADAAAASPRAAPLGGYGKSSGNGGGGGRWPRLVEYLLREQRLLFIFVGMAISAAFFVLVPHGARPSLGLAAPMAAGYNGGLMAGHERGAMERSDLGIGGFVTDPAVQTLVFSTGKIPLSVRRTPKRVVVTGGAGFVGSHLVDRLMERGDQVIVVDNFFTGRKANVQHHFGNPRFELIRHDVVEPLMLEVDQIYHLACPASPVHYKFNPVKTIISLSAAALLLTAKQVVTSLTLTPLYKTNVVGTLNMLGLAKRVGARFLISSTSEVYGDPLEHPQKETYWGNVNPIGVRSCYDEGKRVAETLSMDYNRGANVEVRIARIFNTYGPRMCIDDGRVVSNFVAQALRKEPMTVYGDGKQTRSFQYVSDLVEGLMRLMEGEHIGPFNLGNPGEFTMLELAEVVRQTIDSNAKIVFRENTQDDPHMRKPDITKATLQLGWEPKVSLREGLPLMVEDFRKRIFGDQKDGQLESGNVGPQDDT
eukprot:SM000185S04029  [mRNA]  locus=s185:16758:19965:- [translate_table: standard]